jgi:hypothetical protein
MHQRHKVKPKDFRIVRAFTMEHNIKRLRKHVARLQRRMHYNGFMQVMRIKRASNRGGKSCIQT